MENNQNNNHWRLGVDTLDNRRMKANHFLHRQSFHQHGRLPIGKREDLIIVHLRNCGHDGLEEQDTSKLSRLRLYQSIKVLDG